MKKYLFTTSVLMILCTVLSAQIVNQKTVVSKKTSNTTNTGTTIKNSSSPITKATAIKNMIVGKWTGTFTGPSGNSMYYALQFNADGTLLNLANDGYEMANGVYTLTGEKVEGNYKGDRLNIILNAVTVDPASGTMTGSWLYNPEITWTLRKQ